MGLMDVNSGNNGDRLKHFLIHEVLSRCSSWRSIGYSETHAGAGIYNSDAQTEIRKYIGVLRRYVRDADQEETQGPGQSYFQCLNAWWSRGENAKQYPGSVLQACLRIGKDKLEPERFRVTEIDEDAHGRLAHALAPYKVTPRLGGFQHSLDWLCKEDDLFLVVDPFAIVSNDQESKSEEVLNNGDLDIATLKKILSHFPGKSNAVILLWTSFGQANRVHRDVVEKMIGEWSSAHKAEYSKHDFTANYSTYLLGFGEGKKIVADLPASGRYCPWLSRLKVSINALDYAPLVIHEAGHATVALVEGKTIERIVFDENGEKAVHYPPGSVTPAIAMAGWTAEQISKGSNAKIPDWTKRPEDHSANEDISLHILPEVELHSDTALTEVQAVPVAAAVKEARTILRKYWKLVPRICRLIVDSNGVVPGQEVHGLWDE
jgi:hypothetical protein